MRSLFCVLALALFGIGSADALELQETPGLLDAIANGRVLRAAGPWRTTGGWWSREEHFAYDSFDVLTSDGTLSRLRLDHLRRAWEIDAVYD